MLVAGGERWVSVRTLIPDLLRAGLEVVDDVLLLLEGRRRSAEILVLVLRRFPRATLTLVEGLEIET